MATFLRSGWALLVTVVAAVVVTGTGVIVSFFTGGVAPVIHGFYQAFARMVLWGAGAKVEVAGLEHLADGARYVVVPNHESHIDVPALIRAFRDHPLRFVAKQELGRVPIFGRALKRSGTVFVTRSDTKKDLERMHAAQAELLKHVSVLFFAEGTRTHTGELQAFKKGAAVFSVQTGLPLLPVGIAGSYEVLPRGMRLLRRGATIGVSIGEPIDTRGRTVDEREVLTSELRAAVVKEIARARDLLPAG
ncbi:MAG TPA: lysophospholipid acyltransferase family protein [Myxococcota bacterium]|nr:lysophospholipid acyltransferase family protein [Myxococcota bacterium]